MKVFSVELKLLGEMSQLPDSQKIFGALMYFMADKGGAANEFIRKVKEREFCFILSNVLPKDYLPVPKSFLEFKTGDRENENGKALYSALKKRAFATKEWCIKYQKNPEVLLKTDCTDDYISLDHDQQVHINTEGVDEESGAEKNLIFSVQRTICRFNAGKSDPKEYHFFIRCEDNCEIVELLRDEENSGHVFTLGKRSSQGYNLFKLIGIKPNDEIEKLYSEKKNTHLNLGMLLPDEISFTDENSFLELFSSERRTFSSDKWNDDANRGHFISFIAPGSIVVSNCVEKAGKCVPSPDERGKKGEIVFGNAFLLPWEI